MLSIRDRHHRAGDHLRECPAPAGEVAPQPFCHQRHLSHSSFGRLITGVVLCLAATASALAQQSTRFDQYELHHSIVYTTFLSPQEAAEYGIARGADKAILTLSVRDVESGEIAGRPMVIEGRTWDLITGGEMEIKEIAIVKDRSHYPLNFWIGNTASSNSPSSPRAPSRPLNTK